MARGRSTSARSRSGASTTKTTKKNQAKSAGKGRTSQAAPAEASRDLAIAAWRRVGWFAAVGITLFVFASLVSFDPADAPSHAVAPTNVTATNWCGAVCYYIAYQLIYTLGAGTWLAFGLIIALLVAWARGVEVSHLLVRTIGGICMVLAISGFQHLWLPASGPFPEGGGGILAIASVDFLVARFNAPGTALILLLLIGIGAVVAIDQLIVNVSVATVKAAGHLRRVPVGSMADSLRRVASLGRPTPVAAGAGGGTAIADLDDLDDTRRGKKAKKNASSRKKKSKKKRRFEEIEHIDPDAGGLGAVESFDPDDAEEDEYEDDDDASVEEDVIEIDEDDDEADVEDEPVASVSASSSKTPEVDVDALREKIRKLPVNFASKKKTPEEAAEPALPPRENYDDYKFPPLDLLIEPEDSYSEKLEEFVREQAEVLEHALKTYKIDGEVVGIDSGPVITLYEVQLAPGTKVAQINSISSDIARALMAPNIRIVPNMAGKTTVGIEVPNLNKEKVRLLELMTNCPASSRMKLPMFLGKDASGAPLVADLTAMPHMLIAGTTGSGKSVCMNTIIMSFLYTKRPDELKLILVDPKMVEMSQFKKIPHLMCPVVTEMNKAAAILEWAVTKMEERYELLAEVGVRDIASYNQLGWDEIKERVEPTTPEEEAKLPKRLPYIVFIIDELADLMMTNKEVETFIVRIAQKARAIGIHLIVATQRPQANVVTGLIKSNMPCRVSFKVASGMDSRIVLDQKGAELLLGQGDMLFLSPRSSELIRAQGTLVDDSEGRSVTRFLKDVAAPSFERQLMSLRTAATGDEDDSEGLKAAERDPLFFDAVDIIVATGRGSVSLLQRRLAIGYTRSSRLIDQMGLAGIIGEHRGSVAREVLISEAEWKEMRRMMEQAEAEGTLFEISANAATATEEPVDEAAFAPPDPTTDEELVLDDAEDDAVAVSTEVTDDADDDSAPVASIAAPRDAEELADVELEPEDEIELEEEDLLDDQEDDEDEDDEELELEDEYDDEEEDEDDELVDEYDDEDDEEVDDEEEDEEDEDEDDDPDAEYEYEYVEVEVDDDDEDEEYEDEDEDEEDDPDAEYEYDDEEDEEDEEDDEYAYEDEEDEEQETLV